MARSDETTTGDDLQTPSPGTFLTESAPDRTIPEDPLTECSAMRLVEEELAVEGIPGRNLAAFVTTWTEPEARHVIEGSLQSAEPGWMLPAYTMCGPKRVTAAGG